MLLCKKPRANLMWEMQPPTASSTGCRCGPLDASPHEAADLESGSMMPRWNKDPKSDAKTVFPKNKNTTWWSLSTYHKVFKLPYKPTNKERRQAKSFQFIYLPKPPWSFSKSIKSSKSHWLTSVPVTARQLWGHTCVLMIFHLTHDFSQAFLIGVKKN